MIVSKILYAALLGMLIFVIVALLTLGFHAVCCEELSKLSYLKIITSNLTALIGIGGIIIAAYLGLEKYHTEQRTTRIKELYFDDTFISLTKSIEKTMGDTNSNLHSIENLIEEAVFKLRFHYEYNGHLLDEEDRIKRYLIEKTQHVMQQIHYTIFPTDFKNQQLLTY